jgi:hypothetical protein
MASPLPAAKAKRCIFIVCTGGPSQLETWDPKPEAPSEVRGPYGAIETNVAGIRISETLPRLAALADRYALVRSLNHDGPAVHELGLQLVQTGRADLSSGEWPNPGAALSYLDGSRGPLPASMILPQPLGDTGITLPRGQGTGFLPAAHAPLSAGTPELLAPSVRASLDLAGEAAGLRDRYGRTGFGDDCLRARRLVEGGVRFVTVNQYSTLFNQHTWDSHGFPDLPTRVADIGEHVAAPFDHAVSALIADLCDRGQYEDTLLVCIGEFGRTPKLTPTGGRDHWTRCWSAMLGGGGIRGGQVIGASDAHAAEPVESPVSPSELVATIYAALGVSADVRLRTASGETRSLRPAAAPVSALV